ncbi:MarR family transcriptional regulator [Oceanispirochaeta crateris]|uniref:MarR family transcriptional regulator n=1 Tax=Oceanispirochaeta crateris TaxID=2518645 RepID=A0A5C1QKF4_9SPIO|nr:MarR family transcriptional regulator [Oceanispirochaeta crateris]QEN08625.1 MarR family transcriptional regulator [Oceanispirochaeta crateris]
MFQLDNCVYYIATLGLKKVTDSYNDILKNYGATRVQWIALYYIEKSDGIRRSALAEMMHSQETSIARLINRLVKNGFVERKTDPDDRRAVKIFCTDLGHQMYEKLLPVCDSFYKKIIKDIPKEELETFRSVLDRLVINSET